MLVTRPEPDAAATVERLRAEGLPARAVPLFRMVPLDPVLPETGFDAVVVTSANALRALRDRGPSLRALPLFAVGAKTADRARAAGFGTVSHAEGGAAALARLVAGRHFRHVLYLAGRDRTADLSVLLAPTKVTLVEVYDMVPTEPPLLAADAVLFYSARAAERFVALTDPGLRSGMVALCLSSNIAAVLENAHFARVYVASAPNEAAMMGLALRVCRDHNTV